MKTRTLAAGVEIPYLGFGTYLITDADAAAAVSEAIRVGYRHIDTAEGYRNESGVGVGIKQALKSASLARSDLFVTTKLWPGNAAWGQTPKTTESTVTSLDKSLERLGLDYVDLYLIHAPYERDQRLAQWRGLVELKRQGNLHDNAITPIAYSSLIPLSTWRTAEGQHSAKTDQMKAEGEQADSPFKVMAKKYSVSEPQILLRWAIQKGYPVLPKSTNPARIRQNADLFSFNIDDEDMAAIEKMDRGDGVAWASGDPTKAP